LSETIKTDLAVHGVALGADGAFLIRMNRKDGKTAIAQEDFGLTASDALDREDGVENESLYVSIETHSAFPDSQPYFFDSLLYVIPATACRLSFSGGAMRGSRYL